MKFLPSEDILDATDDFLLSSAKATNINTS